MGEPLRARHEAAVVVDDVLVSGAVLAFAWPSDDVKLLEGISYMAGPGHGVLGGPSKRFELGASVS
jgi:hypothetical protein